jgi:outer membrane protein OmpA-like peptidoglycan-associated protein
MYSSRRSRAVVSLCVFLVGLSSSSASAQGAVTLDLFRPAPIDGDGFAVLHAVGQGHLRFGAQLALDYANDPLVWESRSGSSASETQAVVEHQLVAHMLGSVGLFDRLVLFAGVPVNAVQKGDDVQTLGVPNADGAGIGDALLGARLVLTRPEASGFGFAIQAETTFPLARAANRAQAYTGDSSVTFHPQAIAHYEVGRFRVAMNVGYRLRSDRTFALLEIGDELTFGLGVRLRVAAASSLLAEVHGASATSNVFGREETPLEALGGYEYRHSNGITFGIGGGAGQRGYGAPDVRVIGTIRYTSPGRSRSRPEEEEPAPSGEPRVDSIDEPSVAAAPAAPEEPGPAATTEPVDVDGDGVADGEDECPEAPGVPEHRGCARTAVLEIHERIYFELNSAGLDARSHATLDMVVRILSEHPEVRVVRVEGYADERGAYDHNLSLSRRRAAAVARYLVRRGIRPRRIEVRAFGPAQPVVPNARTDEQHARNRRVEFRIVGAE